MHGRRDLDETIGRLRAFQEAGADMVMAPGLGMREELAALCRAVDVPVAAVVGLSDDRPTLAELGTLGVRRAIVGSSLARASLTAFLSAAREAYESGRFDFTADLIPFGELTGLFRRLKAEASRGKQIP